MVSTTCTTSTLQQESQARRAERTHRSSMLAGYANLLNTVVGGGILSLPYAFQSSGIVMGTVNQLAFGIASWCGSFLLLDALRLVNGRVNSYEDLAMLSLGRPGRLAYNLSALINCYGACVSYMVAAADVIPSLLQEMGFTVGRAPALIGLTVLIVFPLSTLHEISALRFASGLAIVIYTMFAVTLGCLAAQAGTSPFSASATLLYATSPADLIRAIPLCAFAFVHQTSLFPIYQEIHNPSPSRMQAIVTAAVGTAAAIYLFTSFAAVARFGSEIKGDILINLGTIDSDFVRVIRLAFGISLCLTFPCLHYAARRSLDQLVFGRRIGSTTPRTRLFALTCLLVGSSLCIALAVERVEIVFGFTGAIASTMLSYVLPAAIHLMCRPHRISDWRNNSGTLFYLTAGMCLGIVALINHTYETVLSVRTG